MPVGSAAKEEWHVARDHVLARQGRHVSLNCHLGGVHRQALDWPPQPRFFGHVTEQLVD
jgi:hypothetical protein